MVTVQILKRNSCLLQLQQAAYLVCRIYFQMTAENTEWYLKTHPLSPYEIELWEDKSSTLKKVIPETLITRILRSLLSAIANKKETKPNQLSDSGICCQYREKVWSWNTKTIKNRSIYSLKVICKISAVFPQRKTKKLN